MWNESDLNLMSVNNDTTLEQSLEQLVATFAIVRQEPVSPVSTESLEAAGDDDDDEPLFSHILDTWNLPESDQLPPLHLPENPTLTHAEMENLLKDVYLFNEQDVSQNSVDPMLSNFMEPEENWEENLNLMMLSEPTQLFQNDEENVDGMDIMMEAEIDPEDVDKDRTSVDPLQNEPEITIKEEPNWSPAITTTKLPVTFLMVDPATQTPTSGDNKELESDSAHSSSSTNTRFRFTFEDLVKPSRRIKGKRKWVSRKDDTAANDPLNTRLDEALRYGENYRERKRSLDNKRIETLVAQRKKLNEFREKNRKLTDQIQNLELRVQWLAFTVDVLKVELASTK